MSETSSLQVALQHPQKLQRILTVKHQNNSIVYYPMLVKGKQAEVSVLCGRDINLLLTLYVRYSLSSF